jgi:hypothetical protein
VKNIITIPTPISATAPATRPAALYHGFPTADQQSCIANQKAATAIAPNSITDPLMCAASRLINLFTAPAQPASSVLALLQSV